MVKFRRDNRVGPGDGFYFGHSGDYLDDFNGNVPDFIPYDLVEACEYGDMDQLKDLMPKDTARSEKTLKTVDVLLQVAVKYRQPDALRYLIAFEADYCIDSRLVYWSLSSIELYRVLFEAQPSIQEYQWERLGGAVILACTCNLVELLTFVLEHGADPGRDPEHFGERDWSQGVPLDLASSRGLLEAVRALLLHGAKIEDTEALQRAAMGGQVEVMKMLLEAGASVDQVLSPRMECYYDRPPFGTALHHAVRYDQPQSVEFLLRRGASTAMLDSEGLSPFQRAQEGGNQRILDLFQHSV